MYVVPLPFLIVLLLLCLLLCVPALAVRDYGGYYTAERLANARANCDKHDWAQQTRQRAVGAAAAWVKQSDETLWAMVPGQRLPRAIDVSMYKGKRPGCPECGKQIDKYGNYPYSADIWGAPFKLTCPSCKAVYPKNDFGKYYRSGIDETGFFNPDKADKSLLFNTEHPDPNDPLHKHGVDDGFGWFDKDGHRYLFVAYFVWQYWQQLETGVRLLADAYVYTGDQKYAHKALVLLDRIADVYPDYQWAPYAKLGYYHSDGGGGRGKIQGAIWETGTITTFADAVDKVLSGTREDPELYAFLGAKAGQYKLPRPKGTREQLVQNLDDGLLREGAKAIYDGNGAGNEGMNQRALATCAIALDTNPETEKWLDYLFEAKGEHLPTVIVGGIDRDGVGAEAAPGYALSWGVNIGEVADLLADYGKYTKHDIYRDFPQFKATFTAGWRIAVLGLSTPNIGDTGSCGATGLVNCDAQFIVRGYRYLKDPQIGLAAYYANGNKAEGLGRDIFSADPLRIEREIGELAAQTAGQPNPWQGGHNMLGYGLASLELGWGKAGSALAMYYGRNGGHGHPDQLNIDFLHQGYWMLPDHGYPEFATSWPHRIYVTDNTLSHNTVVVNEARQGFSWVGQPELYCQYESFGAARVDCRTAYPATTKYQRTVALIKVGEGQGYLFDVFRVRGGEDHLYSLHGLPGEVTVSGLSLEKQAQGTYAGPDVAPRGNDNAGRKTGYSWVTNVERQTAPPAYFTVDWKGEEGYRGLKPGDNLHVRYHSFSDLHDVALGDMDPPQNKRGNPKWLRYVLAHRSGANLTSTFAGLIEPYRDQPVIAKAERLKVTGDPGQAEPVALKVTLADGTVDYLLASDDDTAVLKTEGGPEWSGGIGWLRVKDGRVQQAVLSRGTRLALGSFALQAATPGYQGKIVRMDKDMAGKGYVWVDAALPLGGACRGQEMHIANDRVRNASYQIESVEKDGDLWKVCLGDACFIREFQDNTDYTKGFTYEFAEGAEFIVPLNVAVTRGGDNAYQVNANLKVELTVPTK